MSFIHQTRENYQYLYERPSAAAYGIGSCLVAGKEYTSDGVTWSGSGANTNLTWATKPAASDFGVGQAWFSDLKSSGFSDGITWVSTANSKAITRATAKRNLEKKPLIQAAAWAVTTAYVVNNVVRHSNGELLLCVVAGTSLGSEPTFSSTALIVESGGPSWVWLGRKSKVNSDGYQVPTVTTGSSSPASSVANTLYDATKTGAPVLGTLVGGTGYTDGTYYHVPLFGGTGTGAEAYKVIISSGIVTTCTLSLNGTGTGYTYNDVLTLSTNVVGPGTSMTYTVTSLMQDKPTFVTMPNVKQIQMFSNQYMKTIMYNDGGNSSPTVVDFSCIEFITDDPKPALKFYNTSTNTRVLVYVDGYPLEEYITPFTGASPGYYVIDWGGIRKRRTYRVENFNGNNLAAINVLPASILIPVPTPSLKAIWFSDSYGNTVSTYNDATSSRRLSEELARRTGLGTIRCITIGGTGYYAGKVANDENTTSTKYNLVGALTNNSNSDYADADVVIVCHGYNDIASSPVASVTANALTSWAMMRDQFPGAIIVVFGPWAGTTNGNASSLAINLALSNAFTAWNDSKSAFIPLFGTTTAWISGTGKWGTTTGTGNADFYIGADGVHPSIPGKEYLITLLVDNLESVLTTYNL